MNEPVAIKDNSGSFRDPAGRIFELTDGTRVTRILRGINSTSLRNYNALTKETFYKQLIDDRSVVATTTLSKDDPISLKLQKQGWAGVIEHELVPFVNYPYEWSFSMLRDAALLQLRILESALESGWTLKDATPYNIQFIGSQCVFIDIPSFEPWQPGEPWTGYRQFCSMYLSPLMMRFHLGIDHLPTLRSYLDGIPPSEARKYFRGWKQLGRGVLSHIVFPAAVEQSILRRERDAAPAARRSSSKQSKAMVVGLVQSLIRLVQRLNIEPAHTEWSHYESTHSYISDDLNLKQEFVVKHARSIDPGMVWDLGCNTGTFSKLCADQGHSVVSIDGDHDAIELLYARAKGEKNSSSILPIAMSVVNPSPGQGWAGIERQAFFSRRRPNLIVCLAIIHHIRLSSNVPTLHFLNWLRAFDCMVVIEFVDREDDMVQKLLTNKKEQYEDYSRERFLSEVNSLFHVVDRLPLKGGKRELFCLRPM